MLLTVLLFGISTVCIWFADTIVRLLSKDVVNIIFLLGAGFIGGFELAEYLERRRRRHPIETTPMTNRGDRALTSGNRTNVFD